MKTKIMLCGCLLVTASSSYADYSVSNRGDWPQTWPQELEALRKQAKSLEGPMVLFEHHLIPFTDREQFEAAWPHLLKVKSKGAPVFLVRAPKKGFFGLEPAGVYVHAPPRKRARQPVTNKRITEKNRRQDWMWSTYIVLAVDGNVVDLNRIPIPPDTPIVDERFVSKQPDG